MLSIDGASPGTLDYHRFHALIWKKEEEEGEVYCPDISLTSRMNSRLVVMDSVTWSS